MYQVAGIIFATSLVIMLSAFFLTLGFLERPRAYKIITAIGQIGIAGLLLACLLAIVKLALTFVEMGTYEVPEEDKKWTTTDVANLRSLGSTTSISGEGHGGLIYSYVRIEENDTIRYLLESPEDGSVSMQRTDGAGIKLIEIDPADANQQARIQKKTCTVTKSSAKHFDPVGESCGSKTYFLVPQGTIDGTFSVDVQ